MALVLGLIVVVVAAILIVAATRPSAFRIERSATIAAPPERIFPMLDDFHRWLEWSPWEKLDPALRRTYGGPASGSGAVYEWEGNKKAGKGRMEITESSPPSKLGINLDFLKPFEAHHKTAFTLTPAGGGTRVSWVMTGDNPFMMRVMTLFMSMDKVVGKDFEAGLANMKVAVEGR